MKSILPLLLIALLPLAASGQSESEQQRIAELERKCEAARAAKLAPMREEKIAQCVKQGKRSREDCAGEFGNWGDTRGTAGGARGGLFYDLPECKAVDEARSGYRR